MDIKDFICTVCDLDEPPANDCDLIESGILDSLAIIEMLTALEDEGITIHLTQIDRNRLRTIESIEKLIDEHR